MKIKYQLFHIVYGKFNQHFSEPFDTKEEALEEVKKQLSERSDERFVILEVYSED